MTTETKVFTLTGDSLLQHVSDYMVLVNRGETTRTEMVKDAGYVTDNGTARYVDFYTELLRAKGITPVTDTDTAEAEYEALSGTQQDLYDAITEKFGEKWTHEETIEFMDELDDIGITTPEQLDDAYEWDTDEYDAEEKFAEYFVIEVMDARIPDIVEDCIEWQAVWDSSLRYDYVTIEFDGSTYFFRNN
jgi:hypothetical protein